MVSLVLYVVATVLFGIAFLMGGIHLDTADDIVLLGFAGFAAAHIPWGR